MVEGVYRWGRVRQINCNNNMINMVSVFIHQFVTLNYTSIDRDVVGKQFIVPNFPTTCTIKEIIFRSNFISGLQDWRVAFINNINGITPTDTNISCLTAQIFDTGDFVYIEDEIIYVSAVDIINSTITVMRGAKGTSAYYHNFGARMETANKGLRLILSKNGDRKLKDSLKIIQNIMTWKGITSVSINKDDKMIKFVGSPFNIKKYDILYIIDGGNSERASIEGINEIVKNAKYNNTVNVADPLLAHNSGVEVQKQIIYDTPILYSGIDNNLYGTLYVDEKIDETLYPNGINVDIEFVVEIRQ